MQDVIKILIIDDNPADAVLVRETLNDSPRQDFNIVHCEYLEKGMDSLKSDEFDLVLLDLSLPDSQGIDTFIKLRASKQDIPIIVLTGNKNEDMAITAVRKGAQDYIVKDEISTGLLVRSIRYAIERSGAEEKRRWLETKVLHAQKLESLNVLTGSVAQQLNSLLTVIIGNAELALDKQGSEAISSRNIQRILDSATRAADTTNEMLAYSGKGRFVVTSLGLFKLIHDMQNLIKTFVPGKIKLQYEFAPDLPFITADVPQIQQMVLNLVQNAVEAIGNNKGIVNIRVFKVETDKNWLTEFLPNENNNSFSFICLEISDDGIGISDEDMPKIYEPFFTTKFSGRGLGLAAVQGIVRAHGGAIEITSEIGLGTKATIMLPCSEEQNGKPLKDLKSIKSDNKVRVLFVEENPEVTQIIQSRLEDSGFDVVSADDINGAVSIVEKGEDINLIILDIPKPELGIKKTINHLYECKPKVKILLTSSYSEDNSFGQFDDMITQGIIKKPYHWEDLLAQIKKALKN